MAGTAPPRKVGRVIGAALPPGSYVVEVEARFPRLTTPRLDARRMGLGCAQLPPIRTIVRSPSFGCMASASAFDRAPAERLTGGRITSIFPGPAAGRDRAARSREPGRSRVGRRPHATRPAVTSAPTVLHRAASVYFRQGTDVRRPGGYIGKDLVQHDLPLGGHKRVAGPIARQPAASACALSRRGR